MGLLILQICFDIQTCFIDVNFTENVFIFLHLNDSVKEVVSLQSLRCHADFELRSEEIRSLIEN